MSDRDRDPDLVEGLVTHRIVIERTFTADGDDVVTVHTTPGDASLVELLGLLAFSGDYLLRDRENARDDDEDGP